MPGVFGCIDGTHIRISRPHEWEASYVNRKGYHSINVQVFILFNWIYAVPDELEFHIIIFYRVFVMPNTNSLTYVSNSQQLVYSKTIRLIKKILQHTEELIG